MTTYFAPDISRRASLVAETLGPSPSGSLETSSFQHQATDPSSKSMSNETASDATELGTATPHTATE